MREIKFRAWVFDEMLKDDQFIISEGKLKINEYGYMIGRENSILMQYTGLKDKNGVEIYEGDVVKVNDKNHYGKTKKLKYVISFIEGGFMCLLIDSKHATIFPKSMKNQPNIEVIGNIHQNPELCAK